MVKPDAAFMMPVDEHLWLNPTNSKNLLDESGSKKDARNASNDSVPSADRRAS